MAEIEGKIGNVLKMVEDHAAELAFVYQLTAKDVAFAQGNGTWAAFDAIGKAELLINSVTGRTVGLTLFPKNSNFKPTFNLGNANNSTTKLGIILWLAHQAGFASARVGRLGGKIAVGGAIGGVFDDPIASASNLIGAYNVGAYSPNSRNQILVNTGTPWTAP